MRAAVLLTTLFSWSVWFSVSFSTPSLCSSDCLLTTNLLGTLKGGSELNWACVVQGEMDDYSVNTCTNAHVCPPSFSMAIQCNGRGGCIQGGVSKDNKALCSTCSKIKGTWSTVALKLRCLKDPLTCTFTFQFMLSTNSWPPTSSSNKLTLAIWAFSLKFSSCEKPRAFLNDSICRKRDKVNHTKPHKVHTHTNQEQLNATIGHARKSCKQNNKNKKSVSM